MCWQAQELQLDHATAAIAMLTAAHELYKRSHKGLTYTRFSASCFMLCWQAQDLQLDHTKAAIVMLPAAHALYKRGSQVANRLTSNCHVMAGTRAAA